MLQIIKHIKSKIIKSEFTSLSAGAHKQRFFVSCRSRTRTDVMVSFRHPSCFPVTPYGNKEHRPDRANQSANIRADVGVIEINSYFHTLPMTGSRLAVFCASSVIGKTTLTSFSLRSSIVSLSLAYPATGWIIFFVPVSQRTISSFSLCGRCRIRTCDV